MSKRQTLYVHRFNGSIVTATKSQAKRLPEEYEQVEFVDNEAGEPVMRLQLNGATVDISENGTQEVAVNGNANAI